MKFEDISKELNIPLWKVRNIYFSGIKKIKERKIKRDEVLKEELEKLLEELNTDVCISYRDLLTTILYDSYGKEKL